MSKFKHFRNISPNLFKDTVSVTLEKNAPIEKKCERANQTPFIVKTLSKEIMKRSCLRNKVSKYKK